MLGYHCSLSGHTPSDNYEISTCNSKDITCSADGLSQMAILWKQAQHTPMCRKHLLFNFTWPQIIWWEVKFLLWFSVCEVVWALLHTRDMFHPCFHHLDGGQNWPLTKWMRLRTCQNYHRCVLSVKKNCFDIYMNNVNFRIWHLISLNNSNVDWIWNLFSMMYRLKYFDQFSTDKLDSAGKTQCEL